MNLIRLIVTGQRIHDQVDPEPVGHLALALAARHHRKNWPLRIIHGPGRGPVVTAGDDRGYAIIEPLSGPFYPQRTAIPAAGKILDQIKKGTISVVSINVE